MPSYKWKPHHDVFAEEVDRRQTAIIKALRCAGIEDAVTPSANGHEVASSFCQKRAAAFRIVVEDKSLLLLESRSDKNTYVIAVHIVLAPEFDAEATDALRASAAKQALKTIKKRLKPHKAIKAFVGCYEPDFVVTRGRGHWQGSVHAVAMVKAPSVGAAMGYLGDAIAIASSPMVYRPVVLKEVTDLPGAVRYAFKSLQYGSVTARLTYQVDGRKRARKVGLRPPERNALLLSMAEVSLDQRVLLLV